MRGNWRVLAITLALAGLSSLSTTAQEAKSPGGFNGLGMNLGNLARLSASTTT